MDAAGRTRHLATERGATSPRRGVDGAAVLRDESDMTRGPPRGHAESLGLRHRGLRCRTGRRGGEPRASGWDYATRLSRLEAGLRGVWLDRLGTASSPDHVV